MGRVLDFCVAGVSDALDGFIAKRFDRRTRLGALLDPLADKVLLVSVYVTLGIAGQLWAWLVVLVVFRDVMIIGGFLLSRRSPRYPNHFSRCSSARSTRAFKSALVGYVLARRPRRRSWPDGRVLGHCGRRDNAGFGADLSRAMGAHSRALGAGVVSRARSALMPE